jgi:riboflavin kinase/FMN adenylyltransferase
MVVTHGSLHHAPGRCALTIGNFDGVHRGHGALIERVNARARELDVTSCVLTFEPHPREFFAGDAAPARLTRLRDKLELMAAAGVGRVHVARFDQRFAALSAQRFVNDVLVRGLGVRSVLVGRDFRFGAGRKGDYATLEAAGKQHGFEVESMPDVLFQGVRVSSSPAPLAGIFVVEVERLGRGVASLGRRPTVNPVAVPLLEVHLFDWDDDLYGEHLRVRFLKKLRDEKKFPGLPALKEAIAADARQAREYFANHG